MKLQIERHPELNMLTAYEVGRVAINGQWWSQSVWFPAQGDIRVWDVAELSSLAPHHFLEIVECKPEVLIVGTGKNSHFLSPPVLAPLIRAKIGVESMTNAAACRTHNILAAEGRKVVTALLLV